MRKRGRARDPEKENADPEARHADAWRRSVRVLLDAFPHRSAFSSGPFPGARSPGPVPRGPFPRARVRPRLDGTAPDATTPRDRSGHGASR